MIETTTEDRALEHALFYAGDYSAALVEADALIASARTDTDRAEGLLSKSRIYFDLFRYADSQSQLKAMGEMLDGLSVRLKARYYGQRAAINAKTAKTDKKGRTNYDAALIDYEAGKYWAIEAGDKLCEACIRNNLSRIYSRTGRFKDALNEVHAAIQIAEQLLEHGWLGRFLDQKARILLDHNHYSSALQISRAAIGILELHGNERTLSEAQVTHGKAWVCFGTSALEGVGRDVSFRVRREAVNDLNQPLDKELIQLALERSNGHISQAADILEISHPSMISAVRNSGLVRQPKRRRAKSLHFNKK